MPNLPAASAATTAAAATDAASSIPAVAPPEAAPAPAPAPTQQPAARSGRTGWEAYSRRGDGALAADSAAAAALSKYAAREAERERAFALRAER